MARYVVYPTQAMAGFDEEGQPITIPAFTVINAIVWDGVSPYNPGAGLALAPSATLQIGDTYTP